MQVLILDEHPLLNDSRRSRHLSTCKKMGYAIFRSHFDTKQTNTENQMGFDGDIPIYTSGLKYRQNKYINFGVRNLKLIFANRKCWKKIITKQLIMDLNENTVIHVHDPQLLFLAARITSLFSNAKVVYDRHELYDNMGIVFGKSIPATIEKLVKKRIDGIVLTIDESLADMQKSFSHSKIIVVPNYPNLPLDVERTTDNKLKSNNLPDLITFVSIGTLDWTKNNPKAIYDVLPLLYFAEKLLEKRENIRFIIGGKAVSEDMENTFKKLEHKYPGKFRYVGFVDYDTLINYTLDATFGFFLTNPNTDYWVPRSSNKIYEFINCGVIPITRDDATPIDIIKKFGLVFSRYASNDEILKSIESLLDNPNQILAMRGQLEKCYRDYSYSAVSERYSKLYDDLFLK